MERGKGLSIDPEPSTKASRMATKSHPNLDILFEQA